MDQLEDGSAIFTKQVEDGLVYAEKLTKADEKINFTDDGFKISCQIRALTPKPAAYFEFKGEIIKIIEADYEREDHEVIAGTIADDNFTIAVNGGYLKPKLVQRQGKKMIYTDAFLRGFKVEKGDVLG
ncbi:UNVERIFIED_CONTAM: hypothetical protein GTU68_001098 [Idotea baltica]|nr:hypothetical protein [Idotea baltica]